MLPLTSYYDIENTQLSIHHSENLTEMAFPFRRLPLYWLTFYFFSSYFELKHSIWNTAELQYNWIGIYYSFKLNYVGN